jgi:hypothetical protein
MPPDYVALNLMGCDRVDRLERAGFSTALASSYETCIYDVNDVPAPWNVNLIDRAIRFSVDNIDCAQTPELIGVERDPPFNADGTLGPVRRLIFCPNGSCDFLLRRTIDVALEEDICTLPKDT